MQKDVALLRAIASVMVRRHVTRLFAVPTAVLASAGVLVAWCMVTYGGWWRVWFVLVMLMFVVAGSAWLLSMLMARVLAPGVLKRRERRDIAGFADRVVMLTGQARTPLPLLGVRLVGDMLLYRDARTLQQMIESSAALRSDYATLRSKF